MPFATALVTVPAFARNADGSIRKRGLTVREIKVETQYTHVSMRQLARYTRGAILAAGIAPQSIRQVDVYVAGRLIVSLAPQWTFRSAGDASDSLDGQNDYATSLRDYVESSPFDSVPSLNSNDPIRELLREFRPVATIFGREAIGDNCADAISALGK